ncbi:MAG: HlyD family efflux transporter periplasmic adaptor subunit [Planctomycetales bacterium]|nr:HlyD family efflux transporter periplasmic adaptor subunit [Planctomycetales bacterium]
MRNIISIVLLAGSAGIFYWLGTPEIATRPPDRGRPPAVRTVVAEPHNDGIQFEVDGVVVPFRQVQLSAQVAGKIVMKSPNCKTGRAVRKGELLLEIESNDYALDVIRLNEELVQADAMLAELDAELRTSRNQISSAKDQLDIEVGHLARVNELFNRGALTDSDVDDARRVQLSAQNAYQTLVDQENLLTRRRTRLESAKALGSANLQRAELALERTKIFSPIDGVVVTESVEKDGYIQAGSPVVELQDTSQLDVSCKLHMYQMNWLWQAQAAAYGNQSAEVPNMDEMRMTQAYEFPTTDAVVHYKLSNKEYRWQGVIDRIDGAGVDSQTRMVPCRVHIPDPLAATLSQDNEGSHEMPPPALLTGMFVKVTVDARPPIPLVRLPQEAIQPGNTVWTVDSGKLKQKKISIANSTGEYVIAYQRDDGLQAGDLVVVSPLATPIDGTQVSPVGDDKNGRTDSASAEKQQGMR